MNILYHIRKDYPKAETDWRGNPIPYYTEEYTIEHDNQIFFRRYTTHPRTFNNLDWRWKEFEGLLRWVKEVDSVITSATKRYKEEVLEKEFEKALIKYIRRKKLERILK